MEAIPLRTRTRLAPTPSGYLHLGNVLSFALTASLAGEAGARILLRIDDLDRERTEQAYVQDIFDTLSYLEIPWHEGPRNFDEYLGKFSQIHRMDLYRRALEDLSATGQVFACRCSRADIARASTDGGYPGTCRGLGIPLDTPGVSWRIRTEYLSLDPSVRDFVIRKKDGMPAYQLSSLVDDLYFGVDLIVRGEDLRASTDAQRYLSTWLPPNSFTAATFIHHALLPDADGRKLSKSAGATSIQSLRRQGLTAAGIYGLISDVIGASSRAFDYLSLAEAFKFR